MQASVNPLPKGKASKKPVLINVQDLSMLTARLAQILAEEVDLLDAMKLREIEKLQQEKLFLIEALETHKKVLKQRPELSETIPSRDKHDLKQVVDLFNHILEENQRRLRVAKEVNAQVVGAIREVVEEKSQTPYYGNRGVKKMAAFDRMSVTLNQQV